MNSAIFFLKKLFPVIGNYIVFQQRTLATGQYFSVISITLSKSVLKFETFFIIRG